MTNTRDYNGAGVNDEDKVSEASFAEVSLFAIVYNQ